MTGIVVLLSGGMDSATLLWLAKSHAVPVRAISFDYGQRHVKELAAAEALAREAQVEWTIVGLHGMSQLLHGSSQTDPTIPVPHGHYADESMRVTVVPNRNMMLLSMAAAAAINWDTPWIAYAAHKGDHAIYPDCRPEFIQAMRAALRLCHYDEGVELWTPFKTMTKDELVTMGQDMDVPFELTWSCYEGGERHCGKCGTCVERREAFVLAKVPDPTEYA
jgi:7-cyano-7-deazaguanine synthase